MAPLARTRYLFRFLFWCALWIAIIFEIFVFLHGLLSLASIRAWIILEILVRYGDSLPHEHNVEQWQICLDLYEGLNSVTRELVADVYSSALLDQPPILCLNFFRWLAKENFKKEYLGLPPLEVPLAYPFIDYKYGDTPMGDELERTWSVNQLKGLLRRA